VSADHYLVFETGGTKLVAGVAGSDAGLVEAEVFPRIPAHRGEQTLARLIAAGQMLRTRYEAQGAAFAAIGFGYGGGFDRSTGHPLVCLHEPGWEDIHIAERLEEAFGLPAAVDNDCKVAALGEAHFGAGRGAESLFYVTLGTGIGGGFVRGGEIVQLSPKGECELGHIQVLPDGPPCVCGGSGCVEALSSGPGMRATAGWLNGGENPFADSREILDSWRAGDGLAARTVEIAANGLAHGLAAVVSLFAPELIVIGGGLGAGNPDYLAHVERKMRPLITPYFRDHWRMAVSELGERVVVQGAAVLARQHSKRVAEKEAR
jgi:glucokinase